MLHLLMIGTIGLFLGVLFYGGLWLTTKKILQSKNPSFWALLSFLLRMSLVLPGFYYAATYSLKGLLTFLVGFILAKLGVIFFTKSLKDNTIMNKKEVKNEA